MFRLGSARRRAEAERAAAARVCAAAERVTGCRAAETDIAAGVSLLSGLALNDQHIVDPALVLSIPAAVHALAGRKVHVLAPSQEIAARRARWLRPVAELLELKVSLLGPDDDRAQRAVCYEADIVCAQFDEVGYDLLRDWLVWYRDERVQATQGVAVIDQIDTVLLDQGASWLAISAPGAVQHDWLRRADEIAAGLELDRHFVASSARAGLTARGVEAVLASIDLSAVLNDHVAAFDLVEAALTARTCYRRRRDYEIIDGKVVPNAPHPPGVEAAIAVHHGQEPATSKQVLAITTVRNHVLGYDLVSGIGVVTPAAARLLRELYGLRAKSRKSETPTSDDVVLEDERSRVVLADFYSPETEFNRGADDIRESQRTELTAYCSSLLDVADIVDEFRILLHDHLDELARRYRRRWLSYAELLDTLGERYPCTLPPQPSPRPTAEIHVDAERALAARINEVEEKAGAGAAQELIRSAVLGTRDRLWRGHIVDLGTLATMSRTVHPQRRIREFQQQADERFSLMWREFVETVISLAFHVSIDD